MSADMAHPARRGGRGNTIRECLAEFYGFASSALVRDGRSTAAEGGGLKTAAGRLYKAGLAEKLVTQRAERMHHAKDRLCERFTLRQLQTNGGGGGLFLFHQAVALL